MEGGGALGLHWEQVGEGPRCQGEGMGRIGNKEGEGRGVGIALGKEGKGGGSHWEKRGRWEFWHTMNSFPLPLRGSRIACIACREKVLRPFKTKAWLSLCPMAQES